MPMSSSQLAALVDRARQKPPPVIVSAPPQPARTAQRPVQPQKAAPAPSAAPQPVPAQAAVPSPPPQRQATSAVAAPAVLPAVTPPSETADRHAQLPAEAAKPDDFPTGWELRKESWHFHRRFYAVFRRPMARGEYSHLLWQIRRATAEHLVSDCWRVALPDGKRMLAVRGTTWRLITILPKDWQPPSPAG